MNLVEIQRFRAQDYRAGDVRKDGCNGTKVVETRTRSTRTTFYPDAHPDKPFDPVWRNSSKEDRALLVQVLPAAAQRFYVGDRVRVAWTSGWNTRFYEGTVIKVSCAGKPHAYYQVAISRKRITWYWPEEMQPLTQSEKEAKNA